MTLRMMASKLFNCLSGIQARRGRCPSLPASPEPIKLNQPKTTTRTFIITAIFSNKNILDIKKSDFFSDPPEKKSVGCYIFWYKVDKVSDNKDYLSMSLGKFKRNVKNAKNF